MGPYEMTPITWEMDIGSRPKLFYCWKITKWQLANPKKRRNFSEHFERKYSDGERKYSDGETNKWTEAVKEFRTRTSQDVKKMTGLAIFF